MQRWYDFIADYNGKPLAGATVQVQNYPALTNATYYLTTDTSAPLTAALTSGADGGIAFYAADGRYQLTITATNGRITIIPDILIEDPAEGTVPIALSASTATWAIGAGTSSYAGTSGNSGTATTALSASTSTWALGAAVSSTATWALGAATASTATTALSASTSTWALGAAVSSTATWALGAPASGGLVSVSVTQTGGTLTVSGVSHSQTFRSTSLIDGTVTSISANPASAILPPQATLGFTNGVQGRLVIAEMNNNGTAEYAFSNQSGGLQMNEENLISPTAISTVSTSASTWYATTTRSNLAYKIAAAVDIINTASSWGNPVLVQPTGGNAQLKSVSMVRVHTANGYGSTNTMIRRFTTVVADIGDDITYADSAANGGSFTINTADFYTISATDTFNAAQTVGISKNSTQLTTAIGAITAADRLCSQDTHGSGYVANCATRVWCDVGDIIRHHTSGQASGAGAESTNFTITRG